MLTLNCFCADWGNEKLLVVETSPRMNSIPALFRDLREGDPPPVTVSHCSTLGCDIQTQNLPSPCSQQARLWKMLACWPAGAFGLGKLPFLHWVGSALP